MTPENRELSDAIQKLSKKKHTVSSKAKLAREELADFQYESMDEFSGGKKLKKRFTMLDEFNKSVKFLSAVFKHSNFDELALFVSRPGRVLVLNFFIGIMRGIGFAIGFLLILLFLFSMLKPLLSPETARLIDQISRDFLR